MKPLAITAFALALAAAALRANPRPAEDAAAFAPVFERAGLTRATARLDLQDMDLFGGGPYRTQIWKIFMDDPFKVPAYTDRFRDALRDTSKTPYGPMTFAFARLGTAVRRNLLGDPNAEAAKAAAGPDSLFEALRAVHAAAGHTLSDADLADLREHCKTVPDGLAQPMALLLQVTCAAAADRELALARFSADERKRLFDAAPRLLSLVRHADDAESRFVEDALGRIDLAYLAAGAADLALAVGAAVEALQKYAGPRNLLFSADTPWGEVRIEGDEPAAIDADERLLLLLDLGGNDNYASGACTRDANQPASIVIDLGGDDRYTAPADAPGAFGCGILGYGILVDVAGNDRYEAQEFAEGAGVFGVGILWDLAGDDRYLDLTFGQGSAFAGVGLLLDGAGADRYDCTSWSQGYAYTLGCGLLLDAAGNDAYVANDTEIKNPSAQSKDHNVSMAQGCGFGKRADYVDGHSLAGGVGVLADLDGNDTYDCAVFGQGCGYWYGVGMLLDGAGDDVYHGAWYVQAAAAHFAIGILNDHAGNDRYVATMNMAQGAGHDFSLGFLVEHEGNDVYQPPNLSLGGGNDNGMGVFWDRQGDDAYQVKEGITLGCACITGKGSLREDLRCIGLFLDGGGKDTYSLPFAKDGGNWSMKEEGKQPVGGECGAGVDKP